MKWGGRTQSRSSHHICSSPSAFWLPADSHPRQTLKAAMPERGKMKEKVSLPPWLWLHPDNSHGLCFSPLFTFLILHLIYFFGFVTFQFARSVGCHQFVSISGTACPDQPHELKLAHVAGLEWPARLWVGLIPPAVADEWKMKWEAEVSQNY